MTEMTLTARGSGVVNLTSDFRAFFTSSGA